MYRVGLSFPMQKVGLSSGQPYLLHGMTTHPPPPPPHLPWCKRYYYTDHYAPFNLSGFRGQMAAKTQSFISMVHIYSQTYIPLFESIRIKFQASNLKQKVLLIKVKRVCSTEEQVETQ